MAIAKNIRAKDGDTLCSIAVENGFKNCNKLRPENPAFNTRALKLGDAVKVPEVTQKQEPGAVDTLHSFVRKGKANRVFFIQDKNRPLGDQALADIQKQLAVSNYVPGRQGAQFTNGDWALDTVRGHVVDASVDPDHFKLLVFDKFAQARGDAQVKVTLRAQQPVLGPVRNEIARWEKMPEPGTELVDVICEQFTPGSPFYRSSYLRLVVDNQDHTCKRPHGRLGPSPFPPNVGITDAGPDVAKQTIIVPPPADQRLEILDLRAEAFRPNPDCEFGAAGTPQHCDARTTADVGKEEKVLRVKLVRIGGKAGSIINEAQVKTMLFTNLRKGLAQINVGLLMVKEPGPRVTLTDEFIHDVEPPRNMIIFSDVDGLTATGGGTVEAEVELGPGNRVKGTVPTVRDETPLQTATKLAAELTKLGVTCEVSQNPARTDDVTKRSCDILCFKPDGKLARIISATQSAGERQQVIHTGNWDNGRAADDGRGVGSGSDFYGNGEPERIRRMIGSPDYRAATKNYNTGTDHLCVLLVNNFVSAGLFGEALIPYTGVGGTAPQVVPLRSFQFALLVDAGGSRTESTLVHESGHVMLNAFHCTGGAAGEPDFATPPNVYDNNATLAYSEWMATRPNEPAHIHKRISDTPLTVTFAVVRQGVNEVRADLETLGGPNAAGTGTNPPPAQRYRNLFPGLFTDLRRLHPTPEPPL